MPTVFCLGADDELTLMELCGWMQSWSGLLSVDTRLDELGHAVCLGRWTPTTRSRTSTSSLHVAFLDMDAARFKADLQHCMSFHGVVVLLSSRGLSSTHAASPLLTRPS
jgi:hypothetical protein